MTKKQHHDLTDVLTSLEKRRLKKQVCDRQGGPGWRTSVGLFRDFEAGYYRALSDVFKELGIRL